MTLFSPHLEDGADEAAKAPFRNAIRLCSSFCQHVRTSGAGAKQVSDLLESICAGRDPSAEGEIAATPHAPPSASPSPPPSAPPSPPSSADGAQPCRGPRESLYHHPVPRSSCAQPQGDQLEVHSLIKTNGSKRDLVNLGLGIRSITRVGHCKLQMSSLVLVVVHGVGSSGLKCGG